MGVFWRWASRKALFSPSAERPRAISWVWARSASCPDPLGPRPQDPRGRSGQGPRLRSAVEVQFLGFLPEFFAFLVPDVIKKILSEIPASQIWTKFIRPFKTLTIALVWTLCLNESILSVLKPTILNLHYSIHSQSLRVINFCRNIRQKNVL